MKIWVTVLFACLSGQHGLRDAKRWTIAVLSTFIFLSLVSEAAQASISVTSRQFSGINVVFINGVIELGDEARFASGIGNVSDAIIFLESPGGSAFAAIEIGKIIRKRGYATVVARDAMCASACALIWLAGSHRFVDNRAALGFHAAYIDENGELLESGVGNALVGRYLTLLDLNERAVIFVTSAPPHGMNWLTSQTVANSGIDADFIDADEDPKIESGSKNAPSPEAYDPITAASLFYSFLSRADGNAAAAMVVPEKRGIGPFNELNISNFFGSLVQPLKINGISRVDNDVVSVSYSYVRKNGSQCTASATVRTTYRYGRTLIEKIMAKC